MKVKKTNSTRNQRKLKCKRRKIKYVLQINTYNQKTITQHSKLQEK